jgi:hypothetical protein
MNHRRAYSDSDIKVTPVLDDASDDESVASDASSIRTIDLYTGWRLPDVNFSIRLPGWFVLLVTLLLFKGPPSYGV